MRELIIKLSKPKRMSASELTRYRIPKVIPIEDICFALESEDNDWPIKTFDPVRQKWMGASKAVSFNKDTFLYKHPMLELVFLEKVFRQGGWKLHFTKWIPREDSNTNIICIDNNKEAQTDDNPPDFESDDLTQEEQYALMFGNIPQRLLN